MLFPCFVIGGNENLIRPVSVFLTKRYDVPDNCEMCAQSSVESRYATRCSATMVFPVPGPPLINSNAGGGLLIKGRRRRVVTSPHPFGLQLRAQLLASPNHFGSWLSR